MDSVLRDVRYSLRMLLKSPGFSAIAILTIALGIGATTAVFTVVDVALLRGLPYPEPERLVAIAMTKRAQDGTMEASYPNYLDWKARTKSFESLAGYGFTFSALVAGSEGPERTMATMVSANFLDTLGARPLLGRSFVAGDDDPKAARTAVLTYRYWQRKFGGRPEALGQVLQINNIAFTVIGVLPPDFQFAPAGAFEVLLPPPTQGGLLQRRNLHWFNVVGRLKPGSNLELARADMESISNALAREYPDTNQDTSVAMQPLTELVIGQVRPVFFALLAAVATVLLIACVNVANLLLARGAVRAREVSVRFALGASRWRVVRMLLTESVVIAALGGALGVLLAWWGVAALVGAIPQAVISNMPYLQTLTLDARVLAFTALLVMVTGVLFGITPALQLASAQVFEALREGTRGFVVGQRIRNTLVMAEVGLALMMLVGAALLAKSLFRMLSVDPGFNAQNLLLVDTSVPGAKYQQPGQLEDVRRRMAARVQALPGIEGVATTTRQPLDGGFMTVRFQLAGEVLASAGEQAEACSRTVSDNYFSVLGATLGEGRSFGPQDTLTSPQVAIVNRTAEKKYFPDGKALGKRIRFTYAPNLPWVEIVGVVEDVNEVSLDQGNKPALYTPTSQDGNTFNTFVVRYQGDPASLIGAFTGAVKEIDRDTVAFNAGTFEGRISQSQATFLRRYPALLIGVFATVSLLLSVIGVYGIIAFSVSQRTREIGVRMALGAQRRDVMRLILGEGARIGAIGIAAGIVAAIIVARLAASMLFGVAPTDLPTFVLVPVLIGVIVLAAASVPAMRAAKVDPMVALRYE